MGKKIKEITQKKLEYIWENTYYTIEIKNVKIECGLGIGSKMSPILAEIMMKFRKKRRINEEERIRNFIRYADDSFRIWKGN